MLSLRHVLSIFNLMGMIRSDKLIDKLVADLHFHHYLEIIGDDLYGENRNVVVSNSKKEVIENYIDDVFIDFFFRTQNFSPLVIPRKFLENGEENNQGYNSEIILQLNKHHDRCVFVKYMSRIFTVNSLLAKEYADNYFVKSFLHLSRNYGPFWKVVVLMPNTPLWYEYDAYLSSLYGYRQSQSKPQFRAKEIEAFNKFYQGNWGSFNYNGLTAYGLLLMERRYGDYQKIKDSHLFGEYTLEDVLLLYALLVDKFVLTDNNITGFLAKFLSTNNMVLKMFAEFETANQDARLIESYICQRDLYLRFISPVKSKAVTYKIFGGGANQRVELQFFNQDVVISECNGNTLPLPFYYHRDINLID